MSVAAAAAIKHFDYLVIGGGSGGIASARRAAEFGIRVGLIEKNRLGGTCVNVGCVPKKIMFSCAVHAEHIHEHADYGFNVELKGFDWKKIKNSRDDYVKRLNAIYKSNLEKSKVEFIEGSAKFKTPNTVDVDGHVYSANHILIATGGRPLLPDVPGVEHGITSDGFFELTSVPKKTLVVGAGYIGVELSGILNALGSKVTFVIRGEKVLRVFDSLISTVVTENLEKAGVQILRKTHLKSISKDSAGLITATTNADEQLTGYDVLIWTMGRVPNIEIGLDAAGVQLDSTGHIKVDEFQNTSTKNVYALGDVCGKALLTPEQAISRHGAQNIKIYKSTFIPMYYAVTPNKVQCHMKLICEGPQERVIGLHMVGQAVDEILQGFAVAIKMGATKVQFDDCVAIHPTVAEELVTMR